MASFTKTEEMEKYIFKSERLGFRNWDESDRPKMLAVSSDPLVMEFFPSVSDEKSNNEFIDKMLEMYAELGFCYFAVDELSTNEFIGFIGLARQEFESDFTPCVDVGYRLKKSSWNKGYATEGAKRCLAYAFDELNLEKIYAVAVEINVPSISVMKKIGMKLEKFFIHSKLVDYDKFKKCALYAINSSEFRRKS